MSKLDEAKKIAKKEYDKNKPVSIDMMNILKSALKSIQKKGIQGKLYGLKYKLKTKASLADKYIRISNRTGASIKEASTQVKDGIRFTVIFDKTQYVDGVLSLWHIFKKKGYLSVTRLDKDEVRWSVGDGYQGINTLISKRKNLPIEIQFHTKKSIQIKENKLHPVYEKLRKECDEKITLQEYKKDKQRKKSKYKRKCYHYKKKLVEIEKQIPIPKKIKKCKTLKKKGNRIQDLESCN